MGRELLLDAQRERWISRNYLFSKRIAMEVDLAEGAVKRRRVAIEVVNDRPISHYALASDVAVIEVPGRLDIARVAINRGH
jgi:hypothetical protein